MFSQIYNYGERRWFVKIKTPLTRWGFLLCDIFIIMKKIVRLTESDLTRIVKRIIKESKNTDIGKVYFNEKKYPGFMYVKEILPKYQMYWVNTESNEVLPAELTKDDEMDVYWLVSPDGKTFGYEIFEHDNKYLVLDLIDHQEIEKYLRKGGEWFPSHYGE